MILNNLYNGDIIPKEDALAGDSKFKALQEDIEIIIGTLKSKMSDDQLENLDFLLKQMKEVADYSSEKCFEFGFAMGVSLLQETNRISFYEK